MTKGEKVFSEVAALYQTASTSMGKWMWRSHTQWVADKTKVLSEKYGADSELTYCAALLHDLGDSKYERGHADFETWSNEKGETILLRAGFNEDKAGKIIEAIRTHSCRPGKLPTTLEGKVVATADAMWHLQTNFFPVICYMNRPDSTRSYEEWQAWFEKKIERDYGSKIFFEDERDEVKEDYRTLTRVFGNKGLDSNTY